MSTEDAIRAQLTLLAEQRQTLRFLLEQAVAYGGEPLAPPQTRAGLVQMRAGVAQCKRALRGWGATVEDRPEDTETAPLDPERTTALSIQVIAQPVPPAAPDAYAQYRAYLLRLLPPLDAHAAPYLGLQTFQYEHADRFFGRDRLVAELVERLGRAPLLAVLGASGSGKSSLVRAGLLPLLRAGGLPGSEGWQYVTMRPGARPLNALAAALTEARGSDSIADGLALVPQLADPQGLLSIADMLRARLVLLVDQAEELWTLQPSEPEQRETWQEQQQRPFIQLLLSVLHAPDRPALVILAMRADFLHRAADDAALARALTDHMVLVSPMTADELRAAIERPAAQSGGGFEPGLVDDLIAETRGEGGALPLLEYTLQELWGQRNGDNAMTWDSYRALGGVEGALAKRADSILQQRYSAKEQDELRRVLLRLIQPGEGAADTRRRVVLADLAAADQSADEVQSLLQPLTDARLLTTSQEPGQPATVEISHEALIRSWPALRAWIDEGRADLRLQIQLEEAAREWRAGGADASLLWDGLRLSNAEAWLERAQPRLGEREAAFLEASRAEEQRQRAAQAQAERNRQRLAEEQRGARRLRRFLAVAGALLAVAVVATIAALWSQHQTELARRSTDIARATAVGAQATAEQGRISADVSRATAVSAQHTAVAASELLDVQRLVYAAQSQMVSNPEVSLLLSGEAVKRLSNPMAEQIMDMSLNKYPFSVNLLEKVKDQKGLWFNSKRTRFLAISKNDIASLWSVDGNLLSSFEVQKHRVLDVYLNIDGSRFVFVFEGGFIHVFNDSGGIIQVIQRRDLIPESTAFSADGKMFFSSLSDGTVWFWDIDNDGSVVFQNRISSIKSATFSPDSTNVLLISNDHIMQIWNTNGKVTEFLYDHNETVLDVDFSSDSAYILTTYGDGAVRIWSVKGVQIAILQGHTQAIHTGKFSTDGNFVVTASNDGTARVWNKQGALLAILQGHSKPVYSAEFSPDNTRIVTVSEDRTVRLWSVDGILIATLFSNDHILAEAVFSFDSTKIFINLYEKPIRVWKIKSEDAIALYNIDVFSRGSLFFGENNGYIFVKSTEGILRIYDKKGYLIDQLGDYSDYQRKFTVSKSGNYIVYLSSDKILRIFNMYNSTPGKEILGLPKIVKFSQSEDMILLSFLNGYIKIYSTKGGFIGSFYTGGQSVANADFSPKGKYILSVSENELISLFDISGMKIAEFQGKNAIFSPDGNNILFESESGRTKITNIYGSVIAHLQGDKSMFSPDGKYVLTRLDSSVLMLWNVNGEHIANLEGSDAVFSPDSNSILTLFSGRKLQLWSVSGKRIVAFYPYSQIVYSVDFSLDGKYILTVSNLGVAEMWGLDGTLITKISSETSFLVGAKFSPDSRLIVATFDDGTARIYPIGTENFLTEAACRLPRNLTAEEIQRFEVGTPQFDITKYQCPDR